MNSPTTPAALAQEWDRLRAAFASSLMVETSLSSLAQNLDGLDWPLKSCAETPSAYLDFTYEELCLEFQARGHPDAAELLLQILRETLAFDQPFGEMVQQTEAFAERDNPHLRALARAGIPEDFPIALCALDAPARDLCLLEEIETLGQFALLAQRLSQGVIVGGDLKRLLNALANFDEKTLAELLPYRPGSSGLHLPESLAHAAASSEPVENTARAVAWFAEEFADWQREVKTDREFLPRQLSVLEDRAFADTITRLLIPHLGDYTTKPGRWSGLARWFKR
ncbi:MAG TPA: hypothetical protein VNR00_18930 [Opitutus sp.]|nr:hypothetical protein [Opitutus sp.]